MAVLPQLAIYTALAGAPAEGIALGEKSFARFETLPFEEGTMRAKLRLLFKGALGVSHACAGHWATAAELLSETVASGTTPSIDALRFFHLGEARRGLGECASCVRRALAQALRCTHGLSAPSSLLSGLRDRQRVVPRIVDELTKELVVDAREIDGEVAES